jgi:hypothetical protein
MRLLWRRLNESEQGKRLRENFVDSLRLALPVAEIPVSAALFNDGNGCGSTNCQIAPMHRRIKDQWRGRLRFCIKQVL